MSEDEFMRAIARLERAVDQLEQDISSASAQKSSISKAEYDRLRGAAEHAVSRIDRIIGAKGDAHG